MTATTKMAVSIRKTLFDQIEHLTQQFHISRSDLVEIALENFLENDQSNALNEKIKRDAEEHPLHNEDGRATCRDAQTTQRMVIQQGDVFWVPLEEQNGAGADHTHPHVVIQDNILNRSRIHTVVVCALTSNLKRAKSPGNVLLEIGEANLARQSVVVVSQVSTVDKTQLGEYIGSLSERRIHQILAGMQFLQAMTEHHETD
jgi:mRNA interferase MazF